ncbi:MAG: thiamine pyrophosphate-binding protein [Sphingopyxis sp.]|uniref:thiamine pyrophosphate-binding protein n=1 Tax=Sphingopyxis sp. TaxID=1908224 RepID=UPI002ABC355D|nr:thiamine pyrophosphate-dependent enzyme [Sphingopyxis sp.]MDZ3832849.1 thiamine pyrophosphate-binding protein [Sphingopyxis sp.]
MATVVKMEASDSNQAKRMTGGDALVAGLHRWGVDTVFGVPGVQLDEFFDGLSRGGGDIRLYHTRHEQGAAYMALGYAMVTGKPGVCAVVPGPGVLNAGAALSTAYACNARVLCLTSTVQSALIDRRYGALHEINDQTGLLRNLSKWSARATCASEIPALLDEAFRQLLTGRPQPVSLEVPPDILAQTAMMAYPEALPSLANPLLDPEQIARAAALCADAKNPMIVVGSGALGAREEIRALAELLQAPVVSRHMGRGTLRADDDYAMPAAAALPHWAEVDLAIGIGTRLTQLREWGMDDALKVLRIDLDQAEITRIAPPTLGICADAADATAALTAELAARGIQRPSRVADFQAIKQAFRDEVERDIQPQVGYLDVIREAMAEDDIFVDEMTQVGYAARYALPIYEPRTYVCSSYQGTLGYGYATALGAQVGAGKRRVISVNGDGGFMYTMPELASAVLHNIPLIAIVFADGNFGNVRRIQTNKYAGRVIASHLHNPDFVELARNFGAVGIRAEGPEGLRAALEEAKAADGPVLIEVPMNLETTASPWKHVHGRKVR